MNTSKKSRFVSFCLSLIPGAAQMYMGFMKMGLSILVVFFAVIAVADMLNLSLLAYLAIIIWIYSFFHANNLASLDDDEFARIEDNFIFGADELAKTRISAEKYRKYLGIGLIVFGIMLLWNITLRWVFPYMADFLPDYLSNIFWRFRNLVPQLVVGIVVIGIGMKMLRGKQKNLPDDEQRKE
jgi:putative Mn2+ efflux pump MntP